MKDKEYAEYISTVKEGLKTLRMYGNWSVPPRLVKKYGFEKVQQDLQMRAGKQYELRKSTYKIKAKNSRPNVYYIFELKKN